MPLSLLQAFRCLWIGFGSVPARRSKRMSISLYAMDATFAAPECHFCVYSLG